MRVGANSCRWSASRPWMTHVPTGLSMWRANAACRRSHVTREGSKVQSLCRPPLRSLERSEADRTDGSVHSVVGMGPLRAPVGWSSRVGSSASEVLGGVCRAGDAAPLAGGRVGSEVELCDPLAGGGVLVDGASAVGTSGHGSSRERGARSLSAGPARCVGDRQRASRNSRSLDGPRDGLQDLSGSWLRGAPMNTGFNRTTRREARALARASLSMEWGSLRSLGSRRERPRGGEPEAAVGFVCYQPERSEGLQEV